ncbi:MAG: M56 family metallopeptidase [Candidatus Scatomorpha sp.]|jgi:beta-lactamase regulating signal transducer with metallopeptidase domain
MPGLFLSVVNLSVSASWLILAVCVLRLLLRRAPKWSACLLWGVVGLRLVWPFSLESVLSLIPSAETVPEGIALEAVPHISSGVEFIDKAVNPLLEAGLSPNVGDSVNPLQIVIPALAVLWLAVAAAMLLYALASWLRLRRLVSESVPAGEGVYICDRVRDPFILGLFRPRVYLPSQLAEPELGYVLAHERAHLRRRDYLWKPLGWLILCVHWFNPLVWLGYALFCRDVEAACDESVVRGLDDEGRRGYSRALLECSSPRGAVSACPLAFGETGVKARIKGVMSYKRPALWIAAAAVIGCAVVCVCFLTDPVSAKDEDLELALPEGLSLSEYDGNVLLGGWTILPEAYEGSPSVPEWRKSTGVIAQFNTEHTLLWEDGEIAEVLVNANHMQIECQGPVTGLDAPAYLTKNSYDLYTAAELSAMAEQPERTVSEYWCVYVAEPGASTGWLVSLDAAQFGSDDTVRLAESLNALRGAKRV